MEGEQENLEEETHNSGGSEPKLWNSIGRNVSPNKFWQANLEEGYDPNDLHIPRRSNKER